MPAARPKRVKIGPYDYNVIWTEDTIAAYESDGKFSGDYSGEGYLAGWGDFRSGNICVDSRLAPAAQKSTLLHEVLHQVFTVSGYHCRLDDEGSGREERIVSALENPLLAVLRDNPQLVRYLTEK